LHFLDDEVQITSLCSSFENQKFQVSVERCGASDAKGELEGARLDNIDL